MLFPVFLNLKLIRAGFKKLNLQFSRSLFSLNTVDCYLNGKLPVSEIVEKWYWRSSNTIALSIFAIFDLLNDWEKKWHKKQFFGKTLFFKNDSLTIWWKIWARSFGERLFLSARKVAIICILRYICSIKRLLQLRWQVRPLGKTASSCPWANGIPSVACRTKFAWTV